MSAIKRLPGKNNAWLLALGLVIVAGLGETGTVWAQQVTLAWKLRPGEVFYYLVDTDVTTTAGPAGAENTVRTRLVMLHRYEVVQRTNEGFVLEQTVEEVLTNDQGLLGNLYNQFRGLKLKITFDPSFRVRKIEGQEELYKRLGADDPVTGKFVAEMVSENALRQQIQSEFNFLPDKPVQPGDKWQRQISFAVGPMGTLTLDQTLTYQGTTTVGGKVLDRIETSARATFTPPKPNDDFPVRITKGEVQADQLKGTYLFDREAGRLVSAQWEGRFKFKLTVSAGKPDASKEFVMELTQHQMNRSEVSSERPRLPEIRKP
ncbi:MAG: DUF6263 family protein [Gemmatales bacterium]|nr:DUF6263 family protein [Gemmatales bacterium]MDW8224141.1 DUF6263 family protein [Gemmatales bacterium]